MEKVNNDFKESSFGQIPDWVIDELFESLEKKDYKFNEFANFHYFTKYGNKVLSIEDMKNIIEIALNEFQTKFFWQEYENSTKFANTIREIKERLTNRLIELNQSKNKEKV